MGMPDGVVITRSNEATHGAYHAELPGGDQSAVLTWLARGPLRIANHTYVPPELRGRGIAQQLVQALVDDARKLGFTIVPECSYVDALFSRHPDWDDVRAH